MTASGLETDPAGTSAEVSNLAGYRRALRDHLAAADWAPEWRRCVTHTAEERLHRGAEVMARLFEVGWSRYGWPTAAGGLGGSERHRAVFYDELHLARLSVPDQFWTLETLGPALLEYAPDLAANHLPAYLRGDEWWGQGFSEPDSGSDLASLRTRATADGNHGYLVNGQKIWTSQGTTAARLMVLARTGDAESRHHGLSMLLIDADSPGVTVRPIALASGRRELAEVFFDDVRVPRSRLVGDIGAGWAVAMYLMQYERGMYGYAVLTQGLTHLDRLRAAMAERPTSERQRERLARTYLSVLAAQARTAATVRLLADGVAVGPASSVDKLLFSKAEKKIHDVVFDNLRDRMVAAPGDHPQLDEARADWWYSRAATIMGGAAEVQRGIIADHLLKLPRSIR